MSRKTKEAAKIRAAEAIGRRKRRRLIAGALGFAMTGIIGLAYGMIVSSPPVASRQADWNVGEVKSHDVAFGNPKAPARVTEYGSLTCHHCKDFHDRAFSAFKRDYVDTGKVYFVFRHFPYDAASLEAATAVSCLPKDKRGDAVSTLYDLQSQWAGEQDVAGAAVSALHLDQETSASVSRCLVEGRRREEITKSAYEAGSRNGIASTPTFVVNDGVYEGFMSAQVLGELAVSTAKE